MSTTEVERRFQARRQLWDAIFHGIDLRGKRILDAGTGEGWFAQYLAEHDPAAVVSITCVESEIPIARERLGGLGELADRVEFRCANLTHMADVPDESFDLVGADYLIAAVAAYSPYREIDVLKELVRVLKPGGRIVVTGWEVWPECRSSRERTFRKIFQLRDAINQLGGMESFREHPRFWFEARLVDLGIPPERHVEIPDIHYDLGWYWKQCENKLELIGAEDLRSALRRQLEELRSELGDLSADESDSAGLRGLEFGRLFGVVGCKLAGGILLNFPTT